MKDKRITVPAIIAFCVSAGGLLVATLCTFLQDYLTRLYYMNEEMKEFKVVPAYLITQTIVVVVYGIFLYYVFNYQGNRRRVVGIVFFAVSLGVTLLAIPTNLITNVLIGRFWGTAQLAKYSSVSSAVSVVTSVTTIGSSPLFYIALGRYGITENNQ